MSAKDCKHMAFGASCKVARLEDSGRFMLEVRVICSDCKLPFQFKGLPAGLNLNGATVSVDGLEANLAICPQGAEMSPLDVIGYQLGSMGARKQ